MFEPMILLMRAVVDVPALVIDEHVDSAIVVINAHGFNAVSNARAFEPPEST
jgi:hypothetical protein